MGGLPIAVRQCLTALCVWLLVSCGGGGSGGDGIAVPMDTVRLGCIVVNDSTGIVVEGAKVSYQSGTTEYSTLTDANGICELLLPAAEVAGAIFPAASVEKEGYEPQTILYRELQAGSSNTQQVRLIPLAANVSIPRGGGTLYHLGDDRFEGSENSQFQRASNGAELSFEIDDWAQKAQAGYTRATIYVDVKGWQTRGCANLLALAGDLGTAVLPGGNSPADGSWAGGKQVPYVFKIAEVGTQRAAVRFTAGPCDGPVLDLDDFEINRLRVFFD